jgi:small subunit ribosomal protein S20
MPIKKSAKKALRKEKKRQERNLRYKRKIKEIRKQIKKLLAEEKKEEARKLLPSFYKAADKAAKVGVIKKNTAARMKSKISKLLI